MKSFLKWKYCPQRPPASVGPLAPFANLVIPWKACALHRNKIIVNY